MKYQNFNVSIYCPVGNINSITDFEAFDQKFQLIEKNIKVGKVYLETFRSGTTISKEQMKKVKAFFESKNIITSGGITTEDSNPSKEGGFHPFCYTSSKTIEKLKEIVTLTAELFDEFIIDDFYFTNCRCDQCIKEKGDRSWADFRISLIQEISEKVIIKTAKEVNPSIKIIIKYPNWYEHYQETGYNLEEQPKVFDYIYTGTETRNPTYAQQHLPKYLSYFLMRYLENVAPSRNLGGWFDPYECTYNLTSYIDQGYLTLFSKAKEAMLFSLGSLIYDKTFSNFPPIIGQVFEDLDQYISELGNPIGVPTYLPYHSYGEDYLHNYIGMCGIPLEPFPHYPESADTIFLAENAACDENIVNKMKQSLKNGADLIVTSGFIKKLGEAFHEFIHVSYTDQKANVNQYLYSTNGGITMKSCLEAAKKIIIPQIRFFTNDVWELAGAYGEDNNFPILLKSSYSKGRIYVLTIPDDMGDLYHYPAEILNTIRSILCKNMKVFIEGNCKIPIFAYDNDTFILRSFLPYGEAIRIKIKSENASLYNIMIGRTYDGYPDAEGTNFDLTISPGVNYILKIREN